MHTYEKTTNLLATSLIISCVFLRFANVYSSRKIHLYEAVSLKTNSQNVINCVEFEKSIFDQIAKVSSLIYVGSGSTVKTDK